MKASILNFFEPGEQGHGIIMEAPGQRPTSHKMCDNFSEVMDAKWGRWNKNTNTSYQISLSQDPKNHWLLIRILLNHEKIIVLLAYPLLQVSEPSWLAIYDI